MSKPKLVRDVLLLLAGVAVLVAPLDARYAGLAIGAGAVIGIVEKFYNHKMR